MATLLCLAYLLSVHVKERQLVRREQALKLMCEDIQDVVQATEEIARRIEEDLHQQQRMVNTMEAKLQETNNPSAHNASPIELPLEQAPSP